MENTMHPLLTFTLMRTPWNDTQNRKLDTFLTLFIFLSTQLSLSFFVRKEIRIIRIISSGIEVLLIRGKKIISGKIILIIPISFRSCVAAIPIFQQKTRPVFAPFHFSKIKTNKNSKIESFLSKISHKNLPIALSSPKLSTPLPHREGLGESLVLHCNLVAYYTAMQSSTKQHRNIGYIRVQYRQNCVAVLCVTASLCSAMLKVSIVLHKKSV